MTETINQQGESPVAQLESDSNMDNIEESGEDVASLEKQLAELSRQERVAELKTKICRSIGTVNSGGNTRPKQAPCTSHHHCHRNKHPGPI